MLEAVPQCIIMAFTVREMILCHLWRIRQIRVSKAPKDALYSASPVSNIGRCLMWLLDSESDLRIDMIILIYSLALY